MVVWTQEMAIQMERNRLTRYWEEEPIEFADGFGDRE